MIYYVLEYLGVSPFVFLHWMLAVAVTIFLVDIYIQTEILSIGALLIFVSYISSLFDAYLGIPIQWSIVVFFLCTCLVFSFYYVVWKKAVGPILSKIYFREKSKEAIETVTGKSAIFRLIDGNPFIEWNGELWSAESSAGINSFSDKEKVEILKQESGKFLIGKTNR